jgi:hypothetical protein
MFHRTTADGHHLELAADSKTLLYTATGTHPNGQHFNNKMTLRRNSGDTGLAGIWECVDVELSSPREIYITACGRSGHSILFPGRKQTVKMNFDGKEYPEDDPTVPRGTTSSGRRVDERTIEDHREAQRQSHRKSNRANLARWPNSYHRGERTRCENSGRTRHDQLSNRTSAQNRSVITSSAAALAFQIFGNLLRSTDLSGLHHVFVTRKIGRTCSRFRRDQVCIILGHGH